jgi:hypothetical protein
MLLCRALDHNGGRLFRAIFHYPITNKDVPPLQGSVEGAALPGRQALPLLIFSARSVWSAEVLFRFIDE